MKKRTIRLLVYAFSHWPSQHSGRKHNQREQVAKVRASMLHLLGRPGQLRFPHLARRIVNCSDGLGLWYLRADLMAALADLHGEEIAHQRMEEQKNLFKGLVPQSLMAHGRSRKLA